MKFLVDTNVLSELLKPEPSAVVVQWMLEHQGECALSSLTLAEMAAGVERMTTGKRRNELSTALTFLQEDFSGRILSFDEIVAWEWARYIAETQNAGFTPPLIDSLIAATARVHGLKLVTRNAGDFPLLEIVDPFEA